MSPSHPIYDLGNIRCEGDALEQAQQECAQVIQQNLPHARAIVLGGGHEPAWATFQGLAQHFLTTGVKQPRIGIINLDAHFDLRAFESGVETANVPVRISSVTPFNQIHHFASSKVGIFITLA